MAKKETVATKAPTGLTITRKGTVFTFAWKIGDKDYNKGQQIQYHLHPTHKVGKWYKVGDIGKATTSKTLTIDATKYYPYTSKTLNDINFRVRGCRGDYSTGSGKKKKDYSPIWSSWPWKRLTFSVPNVPTLTATLDSENNNKTTFTWTTDTSTEGAKHFANVELQSILVKESNVTDGSKLSWKSSTLGWATGVYSANNSRSFTEDTALLADASYTRWVRVRSRGWRGASAWRYAKHVYAKPWRAKVKSASAAGTKARGYVCNITWEAPSSAAHPIDQTTVEYVFATPANGLVCPSGLSWSVGEKSLDTGGKDKANFEVDNLVTVDQCMWLRVNTQHDDNINHGEPVLVRSGSLTNPSGLDAPLPASGSTVTVTATNGSSVPDSFLVVLYRRVDSKTKKWEKTPMVVGIIPHGSTSTNVTVPSWSAANKCSFGVYAAQGTYSRVTRTDSITQYRVTTNMTSGTIWTTESAPDVPKAPATVTLSETSTQGKIQVAWAWTWQSADSAEISWSDDKNAWQSTAGYENYRTDNKTAKWYIPDLEMGKKWYVRVRLYDEDQAGPWSAIQEIDLAKAPTTPSLTLSTGRIARVGNFTASWTYVSNDGTPQTYAEVKLCTVNGSTITLGKTIAKTESAQAVIIYPETLKWTAGATYNLVVRTTSASGKKSEWSDPVAIRIATPLVCTIAQTSLEEVTVIDDEEEQITRTVTALTEMPLTLTITGAGEGGKTSMYIERAESYYMDRPDESEFNGHEGEAVAVYSQDGEDPISIGITDLIGYLDDGAKYRIVAMVSDDLGQSSSASLDFEVRWSHQAVIPSGTIVIDTDENIAKITPIAPPEALEGDVCDIYRLSVDKPELIVEDGVFGTTYVDPYPALNEHGGHRLVFKTANGDYITEDNHPAWIDYTEPDGDILELPEMIIDFNGEQVVLPYNLDLSSSWKKDFLETRYLGGSIQGDWNKGVSRTSSVNTTSVAVDDPDTIKKMRRLAAYPGICHVRTPEGSSYAADIQVSESMSYEKAGKLAEFSLSITKVDAQGLDGVTLEDWEVEE